MANPLPIETLVSAGITLTNFIVERLRKIAECDKTGKRVMQTLENLQKTLEKIKSCTSDKEDTQDLEECVTALKNVKSSCTEHASKGMVEKFIHAPKHAIDLKSIEAQLKFVLQRLTLFAASLTLQVTQSSHKMLTDELRQREMTDWNRSSGATGISNLKKEAPEPPDCLDIKEKSDHFVLSWRNNTDQSVEKYHVMMYDDEKKRRISVDGKNEAIQLPKDDGFFIPGNIYTMKLAAINEAGAGEWSNEIVGEYQNPVPSRPEINELIMWSTMAKIKLDDEKILCEAQTETTNWEVGYRTNIDKKWQQIEYKDPDILLVKNLTPFTKYTFRVKVKNSVGWSDASKTLVGTTNPLPLKPLKPPPPTVHFCSLTDAIVIVKVDDNEDTQKGPILCWEVISSCEGKETVFSQTQTVPLFSQQTANIHLESLNRDSAFQFSVRLQNEAGWSEKSEKVYKNNSHPDKPVELRASKRRSHNFIKVRWDPPKRSSVVITHYEVNKGDKRGEFESKFHTIPSKYTSATFLKLKHNTFYTFRVRS